MQVTAWKIGDGKNNAVTQNYFDDDFGISSKIKKPVLSTLEE